MPWTTPPTFTPGQVVTATDLNSYLRDNPSYLLGRPSSVIRRNNGSDYTTTSTSFVDIDATNLAITFAVSGTAVLITFAGALRIAAATNQADFDVTVDGVRYGLGANGLISMNLPNASVDNLVSFSVLVTGLAAGSHTFKVQWKVSGSTLTLRATSSQNEATFCAVEVA